jgi:hypothetical protein
MGEQEVWKVSEVKCVLNSSSCCLLVEAPFNVRARIDGQTRDASWLLMSRFATIELLSLGPYTSMRGRVPNYLL